MWTAQLDGSGWKAWLLGVVPPAADRASRGQPLDPFGTSMRRFSTQTHRWLQEGYNGTLKPGTRRNDQALTDLRSASLIDPGGQTLNGFGDAVLARWNGLGLSMDFMDELPRSVAFLKEALRHRVDQYLKMLMFWTDVRSLCAADVLDDDEVMLLLPFLNQTIDEFNPWLSLLAGGQLLTGPINWTALKAAVNDADADSDNALNVLQSKTQDNRELPGRVVFCHAMDLLLLESSDPSLIQSELATMRVPAR